MTDLVEAQGMPSLPKVGPITHASADDVMRYVNPPQVGPHLPGVRDVALWSTDQMRAYASSYAAAQVAEERERCAKVAEDWQTALAGQYIAAAIRATAQEGSQR